MIFCNRKILIEKEVKIDNNDKYKLDDENEDEENTNTETDEDENTDENNETETDEDENTDENNETETDEENTDTETDEENTDENNETETDKYRLPQDEDENDETETDEENTDENNDTETNEDENADENNDTETDNEDNNGEEDELKKLEQDIFSNMTPEQINLQDKTLRSNFNDMYNEICNVIERLKNMDKPSDNLKLFTFIENKLKDTKQLVYDYINNKYKNSTYIENNKQYQIFISILLNINQLFINLTEKK